MASAREAFDRGVAAAQAGDSEGARTASAAHREALARIERLRRKLRGGDGV
jgi:hypothetical protein